MDARAGPQRRQRVELWCWRLLGVPFSKAFKPVSLKRNQSWILIGRTDTEAEAPILWPPDANSQTHWKRPWCWERLKAEGERDDRGWDGWMEAPTQWTWVLVASRSWWWTGRPGVLQSMGSQRVGHDWVTELDWTYFRKSESGKTVVLFVCWSYFTAFGSLLLMIGKWYVRDFEDEKEYDSNMKNPGGWKFPRRLLGNIDKLTDNFISQKSS